MYRIFSVSLNLSLDVTLERSESLLMSVCFLFDAGDRDAANSWEAEPALRSNLLSICVSDIVLVLIRLNGILESLATTN